MGFMRVTQNMMVRRTLSDLNNQTRQLMQLQEQLATGLRVNAPSDDPMAARRAVNIRAAIAKNEQYMTNISSCEPQLTESASSIQTVISILQRTRELTVQGSNGTNSQAQLNLIAVEVNQLIENLYSEANHRTQGRYIFGGTITTQQPFTAVRDASGEITSVVYSGNDSHIQIATGDTTQIDINETGHDAFMSRIDMFQLLINIRDDLRAQNFNSLGNTRLTELNTAQEQALASVARVGAIQNQLERMKGNLDDYVQQLRMTLSDNIDADYAETIINLDAASNAFTAALNAAGRILQPSLLDFLA